MLASAESVYDEQGTQAIPTSAISRLDMLWPQ